MTDKRHDISTQLSQPVWVITKLPTSQKRHKWAVPDSWWSISIHRVFVSAQERALFPLPPLTVHMDLFISCSTENWRRCLLETSIHKKDKVKSNEKSNSNEKIEASANMHSVNGMQSLKTCLQWTHLFDKHSIEQIISFLWVDLFIHKLRLQESQKDCCIPSQRSSVSPSFALFPAALAHRAQSFPLAVLQEQSWCQCSWLDPVGGNQPFPTTGVG